MFSEPAHRRGRIIRIEMHVDDTRRLARGDRLIQRLFKAVLGGHVESVQGSEQLAKTIEASLAEVVEQAV